MENGVDHGVEEFAPHSRPEHPADDTLKDVDRGPHALGETFFAFGVQTQLIPERLYGD